MNISDFQYKYLYLVLVFFLLHFSIPAFASFPSTAIEEICDNNIDDDLDGFVDFFDPDCNCGIVTNPTGLVPNPSFDLSSGCCTNIGEPSENCISNWEIINGTPDYLVPSCGNEGDAALFIEEYDDSFIAFGVTTSITESMAICLDYPLITGKTYEIVMVTAYCDWCAFSNVVGGFGVYGFSTNDCGNLYNNPILKNTTCANPFFDSAQKLITIQDDNSLTEWDTTRITFIAESDMNAIIIGPECETINSNLNYWAVDYIQIKDVIPFEYNEAIVFNEDCENPSISVPFTDTLNYQWYLDSIEIEGATSNILDLNDLPSIGYYTVFVSTIDGCILVGPYHFECIDQEICDNGIDDDGDGQIDVFDPDCECYDASQNVVPNYTFEETNGCCTAISNQDENCIVDWERINISPDYFSPVCGDAEVGSYFLNICESSFLAFISTPEWAESMAVCLDEPLLKGQTYQVALSYALSSTSNISSLSGFSLYGFNIGNAECGMLGLENLNTPSICEISVLDNYQELASIDNHTTPLKWETRFFEFVAQTDMNAIIIDTDCKLYDDPTNNNISYWAVNSIRIQKTKFWNYDEDISFNSNCLNPQLTVPFTDSLAFQWYGDSIKLEGEIYNTLDIDLSKNIETYHLYVWNEQGCELVCAYDFVFPSFEVQVQDTICEGDEYWLPSGEIVDQPGTYASSLFSSLGCDSLVTTFLAFYEDESCVQIEICMNGIDDDNDGFIDCEDDDCFSVSIFDITHCEGDSLTLEGLTFVPTEEELSYQYLNTKGCDSTIHYTINYITSDYRIDYDNNFDCNYFSFQVCKINVLNSNADIILHFYGIVPGSNGQLNLLHTGVIEPNPNSNCIDGSFLTSNIDFSPYEEFIVVINNQIINTFSELDDNDNIELECDNKNNYFIAQIPIIDPFDIEFTGSLCEDDLVLNGPSGYTYSWNTASTEQEIFIDTPGIYSLTITNNCGKSNEATIEIDASENINMNPILTHTCEGSNDGAIVLDFGSENIDGYTFDWENNNSTSHDIHNLEPGIYGVTISYNNCNFVYSFEILNLPDVQFDLLYSDSLCSNDNSGYIEFSNLNNAETILLNNQTVQAPFIINDLSHGLYEVYIQNIDGCDSIFTIEIAQFPAIIGNISFSDSLCIEDTLGYIEILNSEDIYQAFVNEIEITSPYIIDNLPAGTYQVDMINKNGCMTNEEVIIHQVESINLPLPDTITLGLEENYSFSFPDNMVDGITFNWYSDNPLDCTNCPEPTMTMQEETSVEVMISNGYCEALASTYFQFEDDKNEISIFIPNIFSPGNESKNNTFYLYSSQPMDVHFQIYDRWGNIIYQYQGRIEDLRWDGTFNGNYTNSGVYVWYLKGLFSDQTEIIKTGDITVIR